MERYRSGHNEAVLKTVWGQPHGGSNPSASAKNQGTTNRGVLVFLSEEAGQEKSYAKAHALVKVQNPSASKKEIYFLKITFMVCFSYNCLKLFKRSLLVEGLATDVKDVACAHRLYVMFIDHRKMFRSFF